jgi:arylsulfatase A-like enzyme
MDLLVVLCDTARADAFSPWSGRPSTPTVQGMSRSGLTFGAAVAPAPWTLPSVGSLFTGELPSEHALSADSLSAPRENGSLDSDEMVAPGSGPETERLTSLATVVESRTGFWLPEALRDRGYRTWGASCNPWISTWNGFSRGFDLFEGIGTAPPLPRSRIGLAFRRTRQMFGGMDHGGRLASERFFRFLRRDGDSPFFAFFNLMELHDPYDPPIRFHPLFGRRTTPRDWLRAPGWLDRQLRQRTFRGRPDRLYLRALRDLYYAAAAYEDHIVGRLLEAVRDRGRPAVVVLMSDHGEHLGERGLFEHHSSLHETLLHVPLLVSGFHAEFPSGRVDDPFPIASVGPWLAEVADGRAAPPPPPEGIESEYESTARRPGGIRLRPDLHRLVAAGSPLPLLALRPGLAVRKGDKKFIAVEGQPGAVFDVRRDPGEEHDIARWRPDAVAEFAPYRSEWERRRSVMAAPAAGSPADREIEDHLRSLGYLE